MGKKAVNKILLIIFVSVVALVAFGYWAQHELFYFLFIRGHEYKQIDAQILLPVLEKQFGIKFPAEADDIQASLNYKAWDSNRSNFLIRFATDPCTSDIFFKSYKGQIDWENYITEKDDRKKADALVPPEWILTPIKKGKIGFVTANQYMVIYLDESEANDVIYLDGFCNIELPERNVWAK
jgi:hypothetical protein